MDKDKIYDILEVACVLFFASVVFVPVIAIIAKLLMVSFGKTC